MFRFVTQARRRPNHPNWLAADHSIRCATVARRGETCADVPTLIPQIYATSEERKQRNRQAQAAFRERRTEYIKQLEETIRVHESNLHNLQTAHRNAAEECLMLRYKNSLLERILLEKGTAPSPRQASVALLTLRLRTRHRCPG